ncbi:MAG TPA: ferredoxin oxidoreductase [bacterium]|nr:ferredoxin oxidoreductase [bacterium]
MKELLTGNEIVVHAALNAGATAFFGYPITPATEIMAGWDTIYEKNKKNLIFLQTEDEMSAGFTTIGAVMTGKKAFTATAGPGNILMQDAFSMAEAMQIPIVAIIGQRGGPSTASVIYSQQELTLTAFGGNGEGYRIVYSPSTIQELYDYTIKAFNTAWKYTTPTFVLTDGYTLKTRTNVEIKQAKNLEKSFPLILKSDKRGNDEKEYINLRNTYSVEEECFENNKILIEKWNKIRSQIEEHEVYEFDKSKKDTLIIAHGNVASSVKQALYDTKKKSVKLFRPITINPFPNSALKKELKGIKQIIVTESAYNQLLKLVKENLYGLNIPIITYNKPALGITPEEIIELIKKNK